MAFDPDKISSFDPDQLPDEAPAAPPRTWSEIAKDMAVKSLPAAPFRLAHAAWTDPAGTSETAGDAIRAFTNAVTFGNMDRLAGAGEGWRTGKDYSSSVNEQVKLSEAARERSPTASVVGDVAGAAAIPGFGAEALAARLGGGALARAGAYGATGAATGAAQGAGNTYSENPWDYAINAGIGGGVGLVTGAGGGAAFGARPSRPPAAATIPEQRATTDAAYLALRSNPVRYDAGHLAQRADDIAHNFYTNPRERAIPRYSPTSFDALDEMRAPAAAANRAGAGATADLGAGDIEFTRSLLNTIPQTKEHGRDLIAARIVKRGLDDFIENPPVGAVLPGQANADAARLAARQGRLARESHAGAERSQISQNLTNRAESRGGRNNSGLNLEAELRKEYGRFTQPSVRSGRTPASNAGFNADEIAAMERFHTGVDTPLRNKIRYLANLGGGGGGLGALATGAAGGAGAAYATDDPRWYAALGAPVAGLGLRMAGNRIAQSNIRALDEMIRMRNPTSQRLQRTQPRIPGGGSATDAKMARDLIALELAKQRMNSDAP